LQALFNTQQSGGVPPADNDLGSGQLLPTTGASAAGASSNSPTAQQGPAGQFGAQALNFLLSLQDQAGGSGSATSTSSASAGPISLVQDLDTLASALKQLGEALEGASSSTSSASATTLGVSGSTASIAPTSLAAAANSIFIQTLDDIGSTLQTLLQTQPGSESHHHHHHHHPDVQNASTGASTTSGATSGASTVTASGGSTGSDTTDG